MMEMSILIFVSLIVIVVVGGWVMYRAGYMHGKHCARMSMLDVIYDLKNSGIGAIGQVYVLTKMEEAWNKEDGRK